jgi:hypothetical protein
MDYAFRISVALLAVPVLFAIPLNHTKAVAQLDEQRIQAVAAMLGEAPAGVGAPCSDREAWQTLAKHPRAANAIADAEKLLDQPIPDQPDDLYLDFSQTGNRTRWQRVSGQRRGRVTSLVLAECLENQGRFVKAFEEIVAALCEERTWVMPAHDRSLANFKGETIDIDLASASLAWNLATADYVLGDKLSPETRELIRANVHRRVLDPYAAMVRGERDVNWWMKTTNNWNAVCLAGVTGAGLTLLESREERGFFVVAAEEYSRNFLRGFTSDGYCSEGLGYWNYGFGHYVLLAETIYQATDGGVDLMAREEVRAPATFPARIEIINDIYPAFADCGVNARPSTDTMWFVNRRFGLGLADYQNADLALSGTLYEAMILSFPNSASASASAETKASGPGLRSWFDQAGVLISRPIEGSDCRMGVALKGGHNAEHHNHNDVGSYVVVLGQRAVLLDPGAETYTARTFSSQRYQSNVLNSFGHAVPVVAGQLQRTGREAQGRVLATDFTDAADTLQLDIASAYDVPELKSLERTFVYSREGTGSLAVTDRVAFASPQTFGTALITLGGWQQIGPNEIVVYDFDEAVQVKIEAEDAAFELQAEEIHEDTRGVPTRIGINLAEPVTSAAITVTITPEEVVPAQGGLVLRNGGFERGGWCWDVARDRMGSISDEQAASGRFSLKIVDEDTNRGSNISSARVAVQGAGAYELRGQVFPVSGDGVGLYVRAFDADGQVVSARDERGNEPSVGSLGGDSQKWEPFAFRFETPADTASISVWIHSYNGAEVVAYVDDLEIVPVEDR